MADLKRFNGNVLPFATNATGLNRTIFGSTTQSNEIDDNLNDNFKLGWEIVNTNEAPTKQDFNAVSYTTSYLVGYLYQQGIAEWNTNQNYYKNSYAVGSDGALYKSQTGDTTTPNAGNDPTTDATNWIKVADLSDLELLNKIKNVDGSGSGLDADKLDGLQSNVNAVANTVPVRDANTAIAGKNQCTAWVIFDGSDGTIEKSFNISSVIKNDVGDYTIDFTDSMANTSYCVGGTSNDNRDEDNSCDSTIAVRVRNTDNFRIMTSHNSGGSDGNIPSNSKTTFLIVFGGK